MFYLNYSFVLFFVDTRGGRFSDGWGSCDRREKRFLKPNHDIPSTAETRAKNKACQVYVFPMFVLKFATIALMILPITYWFHGHLSTCLIKLVLSLTSYSIQLCTYYTLAKQSKVNPVLTRISFCLLKMIFIMLQWWLYQ